MPTSTGIHKKTYQSKSLMNPTRPKATNEEKKNIDKDTSTLIVFNQTTAVKTLLNGVAYGNTATTHVGRQMNMCSLTYRFVGHLAATTTGAAALRLLIVYDKQPNGALAAVTDILVGDAIEAPMNLFNNKRFIVLVDEEIECLGVQGPQAFQRKGHRKLNLPTEFNANSNGDITDINTGAVIALTYQSGGLLVASPATQLFTRIRFLDA